VPTPSRGYSVNGVKVPGTTTVIGRYKDGSKLQDWIWRCGARRLDFRAEGRRAADIGTAAHDMIERDILGQPQVEDVVAHYSLTDGGDKRAKLCFEAWKRWRDKRKPDIDVVEAQLVHPVHGYGGTIDAIGTIDGRRFLLDWKTSNALYDETAMQLAAYRELWMVNENEDIQHALVLRMDKSSGKYEELVPPALHAKYFEQFLRFLAAYRLDREIFPVKWLNVTDKASVFDHGNELLGPA
jgi:hypothetical protein